MNRRLAGDLARWEAGEISLEDLERRHPDAETSAVTGMHMRLTSLTEAPQPDPLAAWAALSVRLGDPAPAPARSRRLRRPVIAAVLASVLAVPAVSYAAAPDAVRTAVQQVAELFPGVDDDDGPNGGPADDAPPTTISGPGSDQQDSDDQPPTSGPGPGDTGGGGEDTDAPAGAGHGTTPGDTFDDGTTTEPARPDGPHD